MARVVGAIALVAGLTLGATAAPAPVAADPTDTYWPSGLRSYQYDLGGCLYKVLWGDFMGSGTPFIAVHFYNLSACGGAVVVIQYDDGSTVQVASSSTVAGTGSDGCGAYQTMAAVGSSGTPLRALVWVGTGYRWYADDGTVVQTISSFC